MTDTKTNMQVIALEAYKEWIGVSLHFSKEDYDFGKYGPRRCNLETFTKRGDWQVFYKLINKMPQAKERRRLMGALLAQGTAQPMHLMMPAADLAYRKLCRIEQSPAVFFAQMFTDVVAECTGDLRGLFDGSSNELADKMVHIKDDMALAMFDVVTGAMTNWAEGHSYWKGKLSNINKIKTFFDQEQIMKGKSAIIDVVKKATNR